MAVTEFPYAASPSTDHELLVVKHWSMALAIEAEVKQYFRKFMGKDENALVKVQTELQKKAGDRIRVALRYKLSGDGIEGDNVIEGTSAEEALQFFYLDVNVDQRRKGTKDKGKMTRQRVPYNLRLQGRQALSTWFAEDYDQMCFMYGSGARGYDTSFHVGTAFTGRAGNSFSSPDSDHVIYGGNASSVATLDANDKMDVGLFEKCVAHAEVTDPMIQPFMIDGEQRFVCLMHTWQAYDLRTSISDNDWLAIHRDIDRSRSPIFQNSLGQYAGVVLHKHRNVIRFNTTTSPTCASGITAARALFIGAQAIVIAWGGNGGPTRYDWNEETDDRGNAIAITAGTIYGCQKSTYNSLDFGVIAVDTYAGDPTA